MLLEAQNPRKMTHFILACGRACRYIIIIQEIENPQYECKSYISGLVIQQLLTSIIFFKMQSGLHWDIGGHGGPLHHSL